MTDTTNLGMPFIEGSQAQKHVTHNEALRILDAVVQLGVLDSNRTTPPPTPAEGERHIVATGASGAWAGQATAVAVFEDGTWRFLTPKLGWCAWSADDGALLAYDGTGWVTASSGGTSGTVTQLGINTTVSTPNLLTVRSNAALFNALATADSGTGDVRLQLSKEASGKTASLFFSDAFSGRAEFGLTGDDDFHLKVSGDGSTWRDAMKFDRTTGRVAFPSGGAREILTANRIYYVRTDGSDSNNGLTNTSGGAFLTIQKAVDTITSLDLATYNITIQIADGTYTGGLIVNVPWLGSGDVTLQGNVSTPANVVISTTSAHCISVQNNGRLKIGGFKFQTTTFGIALVATSGGRIDITSPVNFGACATYHMNADGGGKILCSVNYTISGSTSAHAVAISFGYFYVAVNTITVTGSPALGIFAQCTRTGYMEWISNTFSGSATGQRYSAATGGAIFVNGAGASYFPGNAAGSATAPGWYG